MRSGLEKTSVRTPAVAGLFYPADPAELRSVVSGFMKEASVNSSQPAPKALISPHAGYIYSGAVAAEAYARVAMQRSSIRRIVLIGPSHRVYLEGIALAAVDAFATPLGEIPIDRELKAALLQRGDVTMADAPHESEHCLEVQLPFLQMLFEDFTLLPLVAGSASPQHVASVLETVWGGPETLIVASSDLSHYHDYVTAQRIDAATAAAILNREATLSGNQACGAVGINGLLQLAAKRELTVAQIARCNSGDTAGDRSAVVGYGAFVIHDAHAPEPRRAH